jgi:hypothetical protein
LLSYQEQAFDKTSDDYTKAIHVFRDFVKSDGKLSKRLREELLKLMHNSFNYSHFPSLDIRKNNLAIGPQGRLILLDIFWTESKIRKLSTRSKKSVFLVA